MSPLKRPTPVLSQVCIVCECMSMCGPKRTRIPDDVKRISDGRIEINGTMLENDYLLCTAAHFIFFSLVTWTKSASAMTSAGCSPSESDQH